MDTWVFAGASSMVASLIIQRERFATALLVDLRSFALVSLIATWDFAAGAALAHLASRLPGANWADDWLWWVFFGAALPSLIRTKYLHRRIGDVHVGLSTVYLPIREVLEDYLADAISVGSSERAAREAARAKALGYTAKQIENKMKKYVVQNPRLSEEEQAQRVGRITGAAKTGTNDERRTRLFELMTTYRMVSVKKQILQPRQRKGR